jgi:hypothetical protein
MPALRIISLLLSYSLGASLAAFAGFWWLLPVQAQAQFGLQARAVQMSIFFLLSLAFLLNHLPLGWRHIRKQDHFILKLAGLSICLVGFVYGLTLPQ